MAQVRETIKEAAEMGVFEEAEHLEDYPLGDLTVGLGRY